jgi:hypothetical protein
MRRITGMFVLALVAGGLAGCGGKSEAEKEREKEAKSGRGTVTCSGKAMSGETGLPADFPELSGIIYVKASEAGPSHVVDGYANTALEELYRDYKSEFENAGYTILFDEIEEDDAEISYKTKDESSEGQVALRSCDEDKTSVHITNRPE